MQALLIGVARRKADNNTEQTIMQNKYTEQAGNAAKPRRTACLTCRQAGNARRDNGSTKADKR